MKTLHQFAVFMASLLLAQNVIAADLAGLWKAHDDKGKPTGYIRIVEANAIYSGVIEKGLASDKEEQFCTACPGERKGQKLIGMTILKGVVAKGNGRYQGAEILDPFSGNTYRVKLQLKEVGTTLEVRGYVGLSLFGRTQIWTRADNGK